jgi:hypothetical protein
MGQNENDKVSLASHLGISKCDVKVLFLEIDLPNVAVFVADNKLEK